MDRSVMTVVLGALIAVGGCGGGGGGAGEGVPLVSTSLAGVYNGQAFTPAFGAALVYMGSNLIAVGDGPLNCGSPQRNEPPSGTNSIIHMPAIDAGSYSSVFVDMIQNKGSYRGVGSNSGSVTIATVDAGSIAGSITYSYTDSMTGGSYGISGSFEVSRCPM